MFGGPVLCRDGVPYLCGTMNFKPAKIRIYPVRPIRSRPRPTGGFLESPHPVTQALILVIVSGLIGIALGGAF